MAYDNTLNDLRNAFNNYSAEEEKLAQLYSQARSDRAASYESSKASLENDTNAKRSQAAADNLLQERNFYNMLAQRGLGFSGEAAQAKINSGISLSNRLSELAAAELEAKAKLDSDYNSDVSGIYRDELKAGADITERKNSLLEDIAELELKAEQARAETKAAQSTQTKTNETETASKEKTPYQPPLTAKELAKQLIASATGGSTVTDASQNQSVKNALDKITDAYDLSDDYLNDLMFALNAGGYIDKKSSADESASVVEKLKTRARNYFLNAYNQFSSVFKALGWNDSIVIGKATELAQYIEMNFIYSEAESESQFKDICSALGFKATKINSFLNNKKN